jgi:hypothetical protein
MSIHTRQLPTNSTRLLDTLVDPNARQKESPTPAASGAPIDRQTITPPDDPPRRRSAGAETSETGDTSDVPWYRRETWLAVQITAILPILGAMLVPAPYRLPLCVLGGALIAIGTLMLLRHKPTTASSESGSAKSR